MRVALIFLSGNLDTFALPGLVSLTALVIVVLSLIGTRMRDAGLRVGIMTLVVGAGVATAVRGQIPGLTLTFTD